MRIKSTAFLWLITLIVVVLGAKQSTPTSAPAASLRVSGEGIETKAFDPAAFEALPRMTLTVKEKDGVSSTYEGVRVSDILMSANMNFGQSLRGPRLADYLLAESGDGYRVVFALPELDPEFSDRVVMVADRCDGKALNERDGPMRIIVSDERKHALGAQRHTIDHCRVEVWRR